MAEEISKTGLWIDRDTGKVVKKQPARGTQLVRQGGRITSAVRARVDSLDADPDADPIPAAEALESAVAAPVEQAADTKKPAARTRKSK